VSKVIKEKDIFNARILIVDDQKFDIRLLERILKNAGYLATSSTTDPFKVCELHHSNRYDLILLDIEMPGMDGFAVIESLKKIDPDDYLPVVVVTAQSSHKLRALQLGAKDFISKPFDLPEVLARVHNLLQVRLLHEESKKYSKALYQSLQKVEANREVIVRQSTEVKRLYDQIVAEQKTTERLLLNVLPQSIAAQLKVQIGVTSNGLLDVIGDSFSPLIADSFEDVTVLFADIVGFTKFSAGVSPGTLVFLLNEIFTCFDNIADNHGLEKIKTIGDAYMAVAGAPVPKIDHVTQTAHMALDMMEALDEFNRRKGYTLKMRIGINSGAVVAGVIGKRKFIYDLWGDTVNTASRMESHGVDGHIQMTEMTRQRLDEQFVIEERGVIDVKGIGQMHTWFLVGRNSADAVEPVMSE
jgi:adenylate cyclase